MVNAIIAALATLLLAMAAALAREARRNSRIEEEKELEVQKNEVLRRQMETVNEVRKELNLIDKEEPPENVEAPAAGDSDSRLDRLNRLHDKANGTG